MDRYQQELTRMLKYAKCLKIVIYNTKQVMYARQIDQKSAVFEKALEVGDAYMLRSKVC